MYMNVVSPENDHSGLDDFIFLSTMSKKDSYVNIPINVTYKSKTRCLFLLLFSSSWAENLSGDLIVESVTKDNKHHFGDEGRGRIN